MRKFVDTAPLIYIIEGHPEFADYTINFISESLIQGDSFVTSVITVMEFGVKPEKENRKDIIDKFNEFLNKINVEVEDVDKEIATKAYQLRAKYQFLKGMDALQIATALITNCDEFITNDKKLSKVEEISIKLIEKENPAHNK